MGLNPVGITHGSKSILLEVFREALQRQRNNFPLDVVRESVHFFHLNPNARVQIRRINPTRTETIKAFKRNIRLSFQF
jgi:hypothetical protein